MQQLTFVEPGKVEFREVPAPRLEGATQALVRPLTVARCDIDFALAAGIVPVPGPFALGHECIAEVIEIGASVTTVLPGDKVIVPFQISCGACGRCRAGQTGSCTEVPKRAAYGLSPFSGTEFGGAVADVLRVPFADAMLLPFPAELDAASAAALGDNAIDGFRCVFEPLSAEPNAAVLVVGGGAPSVGLYAVAAARALGASEVVYVDESSERSAIAERLGARIVRQRPTPGLRLGRFRVTVDASSIADGLRFAIASTDVWGTCTSAGIYFQELPLPLLDMYMHGIRFLTGRVDVRRDLPAALALLQNGAFDVASIATRVVPWQDAPTAWVEPATKLVVRR